MKKLRSIVLTGILFSGILLSGCKKEKVYTYEVNDVSVSNPSANKPNVKSDIEFISIAYTDLFGTTIPQNKLEDLSLAYISFGDKAVIIDMLIRNFLNDPSAQIPTKAEMQTDIDDFVFDSYKKFYVREPNAFEHWFVKDLIQQDTSITPEVIYYAFMTSDEYRYY